MFLEIYVLQVIAVSFISLVNGDCLSAPGFNDGAMLSQQSFVVDSLASIFNYTCIELPCAVEDLIKFSSIKNGESDILDLFVKDEKSIRKNLDLNAPTIIVIPAVITADLFVDSAFILDWLKLIGSTNNRNVILIDINGLANQNYGCIARILAPQIADYLAIVIQTLIHRCGVSQNDLWICGHSIGAHLAALTSERIPNKIPVCFALDPAGPLYNEGLVPGVRPCSCGLVYALHTNGALLGIPQRVGTIDVYVNGGEVQPGCDTFAVPLCSHWRAISLDKAEMENPYKFFVTSPLGQYELYDIDNTPPGVYNLETSGCYPYLL